MSRRLQTSLSSNSIFSLVAAVGATLAMQGCGSDSAGFQTNPPLSTSGTGSGPMVGTNRLDIAMVVDSGMLMPFATKAMEICGPMNKCEFHVKSAKMTFDQAHSLAVMNFEAGFTGDVKVAIKPGTGTDVAVSVGTIKAPHGGGTLDASISYDQMKLDTLRDYFLKSSIVFEVSGPTNWNMFETNKLGIIMAVVLEVASKG